MTAPKILILSFQFNYLKLLGFLFKNLILQQKIQKINYERFSQ